MGRQGRPAAPDRRVLAEDGAALAVWVHEPAAPPAAGPPPVVVLAHGWTLAAAVWDGAVREVAAARPDARVVRYDQRGHGASRGGPRGERAGRQASSIAQLAGDLAAVVAAVAPDAQGAPLVLVGHSMGGMALLAAAALHPALVGPRTRGLVLCSTSAGGLAGAGRRVAPLMAALALLPARVLVPRAPRPVAQRAGYGPGTDAALVAEVLRRLGPVEGRSTGRWFAALMAHDETAALPALAAAGTPVRVLVGDADRMTPPAHARALAAALPGARLEVVAGAGHMLLVERPDAVAAAVTDLLPPVSG